MNEPKITPEVVKEHGITEKEYGTLKRIMKREPSYTELGIFSVMWSEHCSYKHSKPLLKTFPTEGPAILQGPGENAGIIDIGDGKAIVMKIESHNHPSAVEPYQGAATGVGGIIRDIFTMGARPICLLDSLRFGELNDKKVKRLFGGVVAGIAGYGNCIGIPTVAGEIYFENSYKDNCLVNAMCVGIIDVKDIKYARASGEGNPVIYVGSTTGRDGIHGATFASEELSEESESKRSSVQVGDPFLEKLLLEACLELVKEDLIVGIQDMGAAGLTCSTCEMASRGNTGIEIDVSKVPRRADGMIPYEVMLSESQERMLMVVKKGDEERVKEIFEKWDLHSVVIGHITSDGIMRVKDGDRIVAEIPAKDIADDSPIIRTKKKVPDYINTVNAHDFSKYEEPADYNAALIKLLESPNIADKNWVYEQYDHMVRLGTVLLPGHDASVIRILGTNKAIAVKTDCNGRYCYLDPYEGGKSAVAESARNVVCCGARPLGITDCLNFGNPEKPEIFWQFAECVRGIRTAVKYFNTPVTGGNVSFYNESEGVAIYPTPVVGMLGLIDDVSKTCSSNFKDDNDLILIAGDTTNEIGGSEYLKVIHNIVAGPPPVLNLKKEKALQDFLLDAIKNGLLKSCHDCSDGGLAVCIAESCILGNIGADVDLNINPILQPSVSLFSETQSRAVMSIDEKNVAAFNSLAEQYGVPVYMLGRVGGSNLKIDDIINIKVETINVAWRNSIEKKLRE